MKRPAYFMATFLFALLLITSVYAFSTEGRTFLFKISSAQKTQNANLKMTDEKRRAEIDFTIPEGVVLDDTLYALFVSGEDIISPPNIFLNGRRVDFSPVCRKDGFLYRLPADGIRPAVNKIEISSSDEKPLNLKNIEVFSLLDTFEEVHFEWAFADSLPKVQPPTHPDQNKYDALHYDLNIEISMTSRFINAILSLNALVVQDNLTQVVLDFDPNGGQMSVSKVDRGEGTPSLSFTTDDVNDRLFITLPQALNTNDTFTVRVFYS
ncbi:MAG: hypothetical protein N2246_03315, partial [Candidatus Sumerlaeia bacterium]|nr:hypothetical protein [Candidatus Sumerlaeia bacterium]